MPRELSPLPPLRSLRFVSLLLGRDRACLRDIAGRAGTLYEPFDRRRRRGEGKWRHIDNPTQELKDIQKSIQQRILRRVTLPPTMLGGVRGRSIRDNARTHRRQPVLVTLDLRDCFPRTNDLQVFKAYRSMLQCSEDVASLLLKLTTLHHRLPQGAPTSSMLANLALLPMHDEIAALARELDLQWTFYVDDIALSGARAPEAITPIIDIIRRHGHSVHRVRVMPSSARQWLTGTVLNRKISVGHRRVHEVRESILALAAQRDIRQKELDRVKGQIRQISSISKSQGDALRRLADQYLPESGLDGPTPRSDEIRPCRSYRSRTHAAQRQPRTRSNIQTLPSASPAQTILPDTATQRNAAEPYAAPS